MKTATAYKAETRSRKKRNRRVRQIEIRAWRFQRLSLVQRNIKMAAAAKSVRTALELTQAEVGRYFQVSAVAVCHWESGTAYLGWTNEGLSEYIRACEKLAS